jgi:MFS transporter, SHS family, sialic acid transporter
MPSESKRLGKEQWFVLAAAFLGWMFDGLEMGLFPIAARPALQDLLRESLAGLPTAQAEAKIGEWTSYFVAMFLFGAASGGLLFGWLGDRMGRVRTMAVTILAYSLFTGSCAFAQSPWVLAVLRFCAALGMGGEWSLGVALVVESWPDRLRPLLSGVIGAASNVGFALIAVVAMYFKVTPDSWRWTMFTCATPAALAFLILLFLPESQRWKESVKTAAAKPMTEIFTTRLIWPTLLAIVFASVALIGTWGAVSQFLPTWTDQLAGPERAHAKGTAQLLISIGAITGCLIAPLVGGRIGRRPAYFGLCVLSLLVCGYLFGTARILPEQWRESLPSGLVNLFGGLSVYDAHFLAACAAAGLVTAAFYGWLPLYLPELFPTRVRATGQGLSFNFGRILAGVGALTTGQLMGLFDGSYPRACATITLVYVIGMIVIWFAPETKGKPLPE